jgi:hypothetical protein
MPSIRASSGVILAVTESENEPCAWRLMELLRNDALNARNYFNFASARPNPDLHS